MKFNEVHYCNGNLRIKQVDPDQFVGQSQVSVATQLPPFLHDGVQVMGSVVVVVVEVGVVDTVADVVVVGAVIVDPVIVELFFL